MNRFDQIMDRRGTDSMKWDRQINRYGCDGKYCYGMADMDFAVMPEIVEAIERRASHPVFGYTAVDKELRGIVCAWMQRRHETEVLPGWITIGQGVVNSLALAIEALTQKGDTILVFIPSYDQFFTIVQGLERRLVCCELQDNDGNYQIDFTALEDELDKGDVKLVLMCNPHNPVGRVWTKAELSKIAYLCREKQIPILSDEIHADITMPGHRYTSLISLEEARDISIAFISPNKTFNISGLGIAFAITSDEGIRTKLEQVFLAHFIWGTNLFAYVAAKTAYLNGDAWVDDLCAYINKNYIYVRDALSAVAPRLRVTPLEGTFLMWVDISALRIGSDEFCAVLAKEHGVVVCSGSAYRGADCSEFVRINLGCPRSELDPLIQAFKKVYGKYYKDK